MHFRFVQAVTVGVHEAEVAQSLANGNGNLEELRNRLAAAAAWLGEAHDLLTVNPETEPTVPRKSPERAARRNRHSATTHDRGRLG